jgi:hypothetical protein
MDTLPWEGTMNATMGRKPRKPEGDSKSSRRPITFKLTPENEELLKAYEDAQPVKPNISAVMNAALELFFERFGKSHSQD